MPKREPESEAMQEGRADLRQIVAELRALKARTLTLALHLKAAARTAEAVAIAEDGEKYTAEKWMGDSLKGIAGEEWGSLLGPLALEARTDRRAEIKRWVRECDEGARQQAALVAKIRGLVTEFDQRAEAGLPVDEQRAEIRRLTEDDVPVRARLQNPRPFHVRALGMTVEDYLRIRGESPTPAAAR